jgi:hypothetical protein
MAISYVAAGTAAISNGTAPTTPGIPAGMVAGDLMLIVDASVKRTNNPPTPGTPSGWTQQTSYLHTGTSDTRITLLWRRWASGDAAPSLSRTGADAASVHYSRIFGVRGSVGGTVNPTDALGSGTSIASTANIGPITGLTTTEPGGIVFVIGVKEDADGTTATTAATLTGDSLSWVEVEETQDTTQDDIFVAIDYALTPSPTTVTAKTFVLSGFTGAAASAGVMWSILPDRNPSAFLTVLGQM